MDLDAATASAYVHLAFERLLAVAERLGDERVNTSPLGPPTNAVAGLVVHCCGVAEFWLGHVGVGRPDHRRREVELTTHATVAELRDRVAASVAQIDADLEALEAGATSPHAGARAFLHGDTTSPGSLVLHVLEELFQHLGHCEIAADVLLASSPEAGAP